MKARRGVPWEKNIIMQQHQACLLVVVALSSLSLTFAQTPTQSAETASPQHMIVPLASKKDGQLSGDPDKPGAAYVIRIQSDPNAVAGEPFFQIVFLHLMAPYFFNISAVLSIGNASAVCLRPVIVVARSKEL
jgi:hypothetical protein